MTAFNYARSRATADRLVSRFGQTGAIRRQTNTGTAYDPTVSTTDHACTFAAMSYDDNQIDGTMILASDRRVIMSAEDLAVTPTTADVLVVGGVAHAIVAVKALNPAGTTVLYEIQARR